MKELDCVEVIIEKEKYAKDGVHQGMQGWICHSDCIDGCWLVNFPQYGIKDDIATIAVKETDLKQIAFIDASINTSIYSQFTTIDRSSFTVLSPDELPNGLFLCYRLCTAYERKAFYDDQLYGAYLMQELFSKENAQ